MGFACADAATKRECETTEYCPEGTKGFAKCPSGYSCPNPTTKHICSSGAYCTEGNDVLMIYIGKLGI